MSGDRSRRRSRRGVLKSIASVGALATGGVTAATPGRSPGPKGHELLVGCADDADLAALEKRAGEALPAAGSIEHSNDAIGYLAVSFPGEPAHRRVFAERMAEADEAAYVEDNVTYETQLVPNDPRWGEQYAPELVNADDAWDVTFGSRDVTIAVVDTGVAYDHPDLDDLFASDPGEDFADDDGDPQPDGSDEIHGTHVTGCAGADTNNDVGVAGPTDSTLLVARALDAAGSGSVADVADGIQWATDQGADVINLSLGGQTGSQTLKRALEYAYDANDVLVVAAAGNQGASSVAYPARYEECVAVSAIDPNEDFASFSNYGPNVEVTAPGVNVLSTVPASDYARLSGTSMAAPVATGVAALGFAADSGLSATELRQRLRETAVDVGLPESLQGAGRVDAANLVEGSGGDENEAPNAVASANDTDVDAGDAVTFDGTGSSDPDGSIANYEWTFGDGTEATGAVVEHTYDAAGEYTATLTVTDDDGATATDGVTVAVGEAQACSQTASGSASGSLSGWWDRDRYTWAQRLATTCEVTVSISGPSNADFDLYVTADGRTPTTSDYDAQSTSGNSSESITLASVDGSVGILVDSYSGSGSYRLTVEETGSGTVGSATTQALTPEETSPDGPGRRRDDESRGRRRADGRGRGRRDRSSDDEDRGDHENSGFGDEDHENGRFDDDHGWNGFDDHGRDRFGDERRDDAEAGR